MTQAGAAWLAKIVAMVAAVGAFAVLLGQVEASDGSVGATRTCGSPFDNVVDRSGWERWWSSDLDEPDPVVRAALVRTRSCPDAVNGRLAVVALLGAASAGAAVFARLRSGSARPRAGTSTLGDRVVRLGRLSTWTGIALTLGGLAAIVVLVADADSTLFLYTDRLVVAVVGLLVLTPTIALFVIGRALTILGDHLDSDVTEATDA